MFYGLRKTDNCHYLQEMTILVESPKDFTNAQKQ